MTKLTIKCMSKATKLFCLLLALSMLVCSLPVIAEEVKSETVNIVKLINDVDQGTRITDKDIKMVSVSKTNLPSNVVTDAKKVIDCFATEYLYAGEYVSKDQASENTVRRANHDLLIKPITKSDSNYIVVTDYVVANTGEDISFFLQEIIDNNPRSTIYFPDGIYTIAYPLTTSAKGMQSVSLQLSDGAVIKAHNNWRGKSRSGGDDALIALGGDDSTTNDIVSVGSYYCVMGGTLDGSSRANGINIEGGRESIVRNVCIKNAKVGILIKEGINNGSSDCDFEDITIIGDGMMSTTGINIAACDNTLTNIRIYNVPTGVACTRGGNLIKNVYVVNNSRAVNDRYRIGISGTADNWISQCYVENCNTGYTVRDKGILWDCTAAWTNDFCSEQIAFYAAGNKVVFSGGRADFREVSGGSYRYVKGNAILECVIMDVGVDVSGVEDTKIIPLS